MVQVSSEQECALSVEKGERFSPEANRSCNRKGGTGRGNDAPRNYTRPKRERRSAHSDTDLSRSLPCSASASTVISKQYRGE